jgi:DUF971 family protein
VAWQRQTKKAIRRFSQRSRKVEQWLTAANDFVRGNLRNLRMVRPFSNREPTQERQMPIHPTKLSLAADGTLGIEWSDGAKRTYTVRELRDECPCATCREKRSLPPPPATLLPVLSAAEAKPLALVSMNPVGNYDYAIQFSDGHDTGIYTFALLRELGGDDSRQ